MADRHDLFDRSDWSAIRDKMDAFPQHRAELMGLMDHCHRYELAVFAHNRGQSGVTVPKRPDITTAVNAIVHPPIPETLDESVPAEVS